MVRVSLAEGIMIDIYKTGVVLAESIATQLLGVTV